VVVLRGWPSHTSILQHAREDVVVDVAAGDYEAHAFSLQRRFFFQSGGQSRGSSAFHHVVSVGEVDFHGLRDFLFAHLQHVVDIFENDFERGVIGDSAGHAVAQQRGDGCGGQTELARNTLKHDFEITYPKSLAEQQRIASQLDFLSAETNKLETIYQAKINELEILKESILQKAFSGKFTTENIDIDSQVQA